MTSLLVRYIDRLVEVVENFSYFLGSLLGYTVVCRELESGLIVRMTFDRRGRHRGTSLHRDQRKFERVNFADTLYSVNFGPRNFDESWRLIVKFAREGGTGPLPYHYRYNHKFGRILTFVDGETFSIQLQDVLAVENIVQAEIVRNSGHNVQR